MQIAEPLALGTAIVLGLSHAFEIDHMLAVMSFVSRRPSWRDAASFGARWGIGHSTTVTALGALLLFIGAEIPQKVEAIAEAFVGVTLIGLGTWTLFSRRKLSGGFDHGQPQTERHGVGLVGMLHGVAGTGGVIALIPMTMVSRPGIGIAYLLCFGVGVTGAMTVFAVFAASAMRRAMDKSLERGLTAMRIVGWASIGVGCWWIARVFH